MNRRRALLALAALSATGRLFAQPAVPRVGLLVSGSMKSSAHLVQAFIRGMSEIGYQDGKSVRYVPRYADGDSEALRKHARQLVADKVQVIWTPSSRGVAAAQAETNTVPIIFPIVADPVAAGFVRSLAKPGTNASGLSGLQPETIGKRIEILIEAFPKVRRIGVLVDPGDPNAVQIPFAQRAASARGIELMVAEARAPEEFETAFTRLLEWRLEALIVVESVLSFLHRKTLMDWAAKRRLPTMNALDDYPEAGGLMSYGANYTDYCRRSAAYVDKILRGANVAELPVEQATKFELVVNLKTARAIGASIPSAIRLRADRVIE